MMASLKDKRLSFLWTMVRVWLGLQWFEAGWGKLQAGGFDAGGFLQGALAKAAGDHPAVQSWYASFIKDFAIPNVGIFNILIPVGETLVGLGLVFGALTVFALLGGLFMNLNFMLAGTTSTNPVLYTVGIILLAVGTSAYRWGFDGMVMPHIKSRILNPLLLRFGIRVMGK